MEQEWQESKIKKQYSSVNLNGDTVSRQDPR